MANPGMKKRLGCAFDQALAQIPEALKTEGFGVLTEIDVQKTLKEKLGVDFEPYLYSEPATLTSRTRPFPRIARSGFCSLATWCFGLPGSTSR